MNKIFSKTEWMYLSSNFHKNALSLSNSLGAENDNWNAEVIFS